MDMCKHAGKPQRNVKNDAYLWHLMPLELNTKEHILQPTTTTVMWSTKNSNSYKKYYASQLNK